MRETLILIVEVKEAPRRALENVDGSCFPSEEKAKEAFSKSAEGEGYKGCNFALCEIAYFIDECNNEDFDLGEYWIGHVFIDATMLMKEDVA